MVFYKLSELYGVVFVMMEIPRLLRGFFLDMGGYTLCGHSAVSFSTKKSWQNGSSADKLSATGKVTGVPPVMPIFGADAAGKESEGERLSAGVDKVGAEVRAIQDLADWRASASETSEASASWVQPRYMRDTGQAEKKAQGVSQVMGVGCWSA